MYCLKGARLTTWECLEDGIPCTLIADSMAGYLMAKVHTGEKNRLKFSSFTGKNGKDLEQSHLWKNVSFLCVVVHKDLASTTLLKITFLFLTVYSYLLLLYEQLNCYDS